MLSSLLFLQENISSINIFQNYLIIYSSTKQWKDFYEKGASRQLENNFYKRKELLMAKIFKERKTELQKSPKKKKRQGKHKIWKKNKEIQKFCPKEQKSQTFRVYIKKENCLGKWRIYPNNYKIIFSITKLKSCILRNIKKYQNT